jgi:hypothetical protein
VEERGKFAIPSRLWEVQRDGDGAKFVETEIVWHWSMMEGEAEIHEGCKGPDCDCWKKTQEREK